MTTIELMERVQALGGRLVLDGDGLAVEAPAPLPEELLVALRARRAEVLETLQPAPEDRRLSELLSGCSVVRVWSRVLQETVLWAADGVEVPPGEGGVYRLPELRRLVGRSPVEVRAIHLAKGALDGEVER